MNAVVQLDACLLCGSSRSRRPLAGALRSCRECDFTWTAAPPAVAAETLYDEAYFTGGGYEDYFQPAARRFEAALRVRWLLNHCDPPDLLEVGSAGGFFLEAATAAGINAQGIEISDGAAAYAREQLGVAVTTGPFETTRFDRPFDALCAFHVLEHVEDPRAFLAATHDVLRPGGILVVEVPNISSRSARRLGPAWPHLQVDFHRWHFDPRSLHRLITAHGFDVVRQDTMVLRAYMPAAFRRRQARRLVVSDLRDLHSLRLIHRQGGDLVRLMARRRQAGPGCEP